MNGIIKKLRDNLHNIVFPVTVSKAVYMEDGQMNLDQKLTAQDNKIGNLSGLSTTDKTSVVSAVNEVKSTLTSQLAEKVTKGQISASDINKNLGKFDQTYMTDEFLQQIVGSTPINATPAPYSITEDKFAVPVVLGVKSKNLFDVTRTTDGYYIPTNGDTPIANASYCYSDYIPVLPNTQYTFKYVDQGTTYDSNKNPIIGAGFSAISPQTFLTHSNARYIRISTTIANKNTQQLELGDTSTEFEPYGINIGVDTIKDKSISAQKLSFLPLPAKRSSNIFDKTTVTLQKSIKSNDGKLLDNPPYCASDFIEIEPNTQYVLYEALGAGAFYDKYKNYISGYNGSNPFTTPSNAVYFRTTTLTTNVDKQQMSLGTVLPPYESSTPKVVADNLSLDIISEIIKAVTNTSDKLYYKSYFTSLIDHLNNPFIKTQIKLKGDSQTEGVGGTGHDPSGDTVDGIHVNNKLTAVCWANMLYNLVKNKFNKDVYVSMNDKHIIWSTEHIYAPTENNTTYLNTHALFNNVTTNSAIRFDFYGEHFGVVYTSSDATGIVDIYVDGVKVDTLDTYSPSIIYRNIKEITGLSLAKHTVEIRETNTKNVLSSAKTIYLEALKIFKIARVLNFGISGTTSIPYTSNLSVDDDFIFLQYGTNDRGTYATTTCTVNNLTDYMEYILNNLTAKVILMSANAVGVVEDTGKHFRMEDVDMAVSKVASNYGIPYISNYDAFLRYSRDTGTPIDDLLVTDKLHMNDSGHKVIFENICRHIGLPLVRDGITY